MIVYRFMHLGNFLATTSCAALQLDVGISKDLMACFELNYLWTPPNISVELKVLDHLTVMRSVLLYGWLPSMEFVYRTGFLSVMYA